MRKVYWDARFSCVFVGVFIPSLFAVAGWQPGLKAGYLNSAWDTNSYPSAISIQLGPHVAKTVAAPPWADNRTWVYTGQIYLNGAAHHFAESIDDRAMLVINGTIRLYDTVHNTPTKSGPVTLSAGWYNVEMRFGNGTGSAGPYAVSGWTSAKGFGYNIGGLDTTNGVDYIFPDDPGDMTLFRYNDGVEGIFNEPATGVTTTGAALNGSLQTTNLNNAVSVYWGPTDGGTDTAAWSNRVEFPFPAGQGSFSTNVALAAADTLTFYRFYVSNDVQQVWADSTEVLLSGEVTVQTVEAEATEGAGDGGLFRVARPAAATNGPLTVYLTMGGTAANSVDYPGVGNSVVIPEGAASVDVVIDPFEDLDWTEGDESVTLTLMPGSYIIGSPDPASLTLHDTGSPDQWAHRSPLIFTGHRGSETLANFPALVLLGTNVSGFSYGDMLSDEHDDLRFADGATGNFLHFEVESWNTNGLTQVWVQVPALTNGATIWALWGRAGLVAPAYSTNGATWVNDYVAVYHLAESGGAVKDSSLYGNGLSVYNGVQQGADGLAGPAARWPDGSNDWLQGPSGDSLHGMGRLTLQTWFYDEQNDTQPRGLISKRVSSSVSRDYYFFKYQNRNIFFYVGGVGGEFSNTATPASQWIFAAATYDSALGSDRMKVYLDGAFKGARNDAAGSVPSYSGDLHLGILNASYGNCWKGKLDEVRISRAARSAQWLQAEYLNMASNSLFQIYPGPEPSLFIDGHPAPYAAPDPAYGTTNLTGGEIITCEAPAFVDAGGGVGYACTGYALYTNLVELTQTGAGASCVYTNSGGADRLVWQWRRQYYVTFTNSGPGVLSSAGGWFDEGATATCTAGGQDGSQFVGWEDLQNMIPAQQAFASINVPVTEPTLLTALFIPPLSAQGWARRLSIRFAGYDRPETLTNFPVMVTFSNNVAGCFQYADMASPADAGDLRFTAEDGRELFYDIEKWDTNGTSTVWVRLPRLSASANRIYAYWRNPAQTTPPVYTANGIVWDNGFVAVYHLAEDSGAVKDSSPYGNGLGVYGGIQQGTNGIAGPAAAWPDGSNDWLQRPKSDSLDGMGRLTLQAWLFDVQNDTQPRGLISKRVSSDNNTGQKSYYFFKHTNRNISFYIGNNGGEFSGTATGANQWNFVAGTYDSGLGASQMKVYLDGALKNAKSGFTNSVPVYDSPLVVGILNGGYGDCWKGKLDEVRISNVARSADWLWAEYMNTASNGVFQTYARSFRGSLISIR